MAISILNFSCLPSSSCLMYLHFKDYLLRGECHLVTCPILQCVSATAHATVPNTHHLRGPFHSYTTSESSYTRCACTADTLHGRVGSDMPCHPPLSHGSSRFQVHGRRTRGSKSPQPKEKLNLRSDHPQLAFATDQGEALRASIPLRSLCGPQHAPRVSSTYTLPSKYSTDRSELCCKS